MTRVKEEFRRKGISLENDFEYLPCNGLETVVVNAEEAVVSMYHNCAGWSHITMNRDGSLTYEYEDVDF